VFLATILAQTDIAFADRWQGKIRSNLTDFCRHCCPFLQVVDHTSGQVSYHRTLRRSSHEDSCAIIAQKYKDVQGTAFPLRGKVRGSSAHP